MRERRRNRYGMAWRKTFVRQVCSTWPKPVVQVMMRPSASGRSSWFVMNMEIVRSRSGFRNKVPGGFIEVHGFRFDYKVPYFGGKVNPKLKKFTNKGCPASPAPVSSPDRDRDKRSSPAAKRAACPESMRTVLCCFPPEDPCVQPIAGTTHPR